MTSSPKPNSFAARDAQYHLHGYTNALKNEKDGGFVVVRGDGPFVYDENDKEYLDGLSGLWCAALGFGKEQRIIDAAVKQMEALPYYHTFTQKTPAVAVELAERLVALASQAAPMSKAYFCNSGSEANDTAVKMIWYFNNAIGRPEKKKIIARTKGYHGVTIGAGSLTGLPLVHKDFDLPIANVFHTDCPHHYRFARPGESEEDFSTRMAESLEALIQREGPHTIAAMFAEPIMGAGGVLLPPRTYWEKIQKVLKRHDILLVADEVICGFMRTGNQWGSQTVGMKPDIMTMAKQLSAAQMPIAAVLISQRIYEGIRDNSGKLGTFSHGYTYSGHPIAAAVALETQKIYEERKILDHVRAVSPLFLEELRSFADHPLVGEVRGVGLIGALELVKDKNTRESFDPSLAVGPNLIRIGHDHGVILRPVGDSICFCPPLICTEGHLREMFKRFRKALAETQEWLKSQAVAA
jgi:4-aminobutyrate--pyruvate transaminase